MSLRSQLLTLTAALLAGAPANGQAPARVAEPPELIELRAKFETELGERLQPARRDYATALKKLEGQRALAEDYEGAERAKRRRLAIEGRMRAAAAEDGPLGAIELEARRGRRNGSSLSFDSKRGSVSGFQRPGHTVTWSLMKVQPGQYSVLVTYGCSDFLSQRTTDAAGRTTSRTVRTGGTFTFEEATNLATGEDRTLRHTVYPTGGWDKLVTRNIGRLRITGTSSTLKLTSFEPESGGLMHLHRIRLIPYSATADAPAEENPLEQLRTQYRQSAGELAGGALQRHVAELKTLEESLAAADRLRDALAVKTMRSKLESLSADPAAVAAALAGVD